MSLSTDQRHRYLSVSSTVCYRDAIPVCQGRSARCIHMFVHLVLATRLHVDVVGSHPTLSAKHTYLDSWYHHCMSAYQTDSRIDDYIATLPGWQQEMCRQVRELVHAADTDVTETIKRTKQPYFILH